MSVFQRADERRSSSERSLVPTSRCKVHKLFGFGMTKLLEQRAASVGTSHQQKDKPPAKEDEREEGVKAGCRNLKIRLLTPNFQDGSRP